MCQLIFVNTGDETLNQLALTTQLITDSKTSHKDGFGFFTPIGKLYKTHLAASLTTNVGVLINDYIKSNEPIIAHVRNASTSFGVRSVETKNSHPFETDKLVLAHNGTIEFKDVKLMNDVKYLNMIDSEIFLNRLSEIYIPESMELKDALKSTMEEFNGKFAFLIYDKIKKDYYVVRGLTATLFRYDLINSHTKEATGFIINTEESSLIDGFFLFNNYAQLFGVNFVYDSKKAMPLLPESIYKLEDNDIKFVGEIKENKKEVKAPFQSYFNDQGIYEYPQNKAWETQGKTQSKTEIATDILCAFMTTYDIDSKYLDELLYVIFGHGILGLTEKELNFFEKALEPEFEKICEKDNFKIIKEWKKVDKKGDALRFTTENKLQFPYIFSDYINLRNIKRTQNGNLIN